MPKPLVDFKVTWKINYCFQSANRRTIPQLVFIVIQAEESFFNLSSALRSCNYKHIDMALRLCFPLELYWYCSLCKLE